MSEQAAPATLIPVVARSDALVVSPSSANGVASINVTIGASGLAAFTGTAANERYVLFVKTPVPIELMLNLSATTSSVTVYNGATLIATSNAATGFQSLGTIAANTTYMLALTSTAAIAANALAFQLSIRQTYLFQTYFSTNSPATISGMTVSINATNGCPVYTFTNATLTANSAGYVQIDTYYKASGSNIVNFTSAGGNIAQYFPSIASQNFASGDNITLALYMPGNTVITGINGSITVSINNLNTPTYVPLYCSPYVGSFIPNIPYSSPLYMFQRNNLRRKSERIEEEMQSEEEEETKLAIEPAPKKTDFLNTIKLLN